jgi:hypothetical protein
VALPVVDLGRLPSSRQRSTARSLLTLLAYTPLDLATGPLLRIALVRLARRRHLGLLTVHHIATDAWSTGVLVREVARLYEDRRGGGAHLPELPVQYADYAAWQRSWLSGSVLTAHLDYWRRQLAAPLPSPWLPGADGGAPVPEWAGGRFELEVDGALTAGLRKLSRGRGVTLFMTLLAAFGTLLHRLSGQEDLIVGTAAAGRGQRQTEGLIGCFINMLPLRLDLAGTPRFLELLDRVRRSTLDAYAWQELPFDRVVELVRRDRGVEDPLFGIAFGLDNAPREELRLPGLSLRPVELEEQVARYPLTVWAREEGDALGIAWTFQRARLDDAEVMRLAGRYLALLESIVADPAQRLDALSLATRAERQHSEGHREARRRSKSASLAARKRRATT